MGTVYKAVDARLGKVVALKVLGVRDAEARSRFLREARVLSGLNHPNVVYLHDYGEVEEFPYLVLQYVEGRSLAQILAGGKSLDPDYAVEIIRQVVWL